MAKAKQQMSATIGTRLVLVGLAALTILLQTRLWLSDDGWSEVVRLRNSVAAQQTENENMAQRNARLQAEVTDLKGGFAALEERARSDLGMVGKDESFYLFVPAETPAEE
jgi:cell division protein FtsB